MKVAIIDYGAGNVKSVEFALNRVGVTPILTNDIPTIKSADKVIFPGVGEAKSAIQKLKENGLIEVIPKLKQPVLGICLGMQLLCAHSEEGNTNCLGIFPNRVIKFKHDLKIPHMGWNNISMLDNSLFQNVTSDAYMYFVHSYYVADSEFSIATSNYGLTYASAIQHKNFYGCQFHPEKSSTNGQLILSNFIKNI